MMSGINRSLLFLVDERVKTFKNWPFSDQNKCNIRDMAEAGFYSIATGDEDADAAKCFMCGTELEGWLSSDDPWEKHKSRAAKCAFVQLGKKQEDMLIPEYLSMLKQYIMINKTSHMAEVAKEQISDKTKK